MQTKTGKLLAVMHVLAWIIFIGLAIKAGAILTSSIVSIVNPGAAKNLYMGLDLHSLLQYDFWQYTGAAVLLIAIDMIKAYDAFLIILVLAKIKLAMPFTIEVSRILEKISYVILLIWVATLLYNGHLNWLSKQLPELKDKLLSTEFILLAGVIFIFSQIFRKGVEIQAENELTV